MRFRIPLYACTFLIGVFFPTSVNGAISYPLLLIDFGLSVFLLVVSAYLCGIDRKMLYGLTLPIVGLLSLLTAISQFRMHFVELGLGMLPFFAGIGLLYSLRVKELRVERPERLLAFISALNLLIGAGIIIGSSAVGNLLINYYGFFYTDLVPNMVGWHKPVLTFATHSLAAVFLYLFFWINLRVYKQNGKKWYLLLSLGHLGLCIALFSHTSFIFSLAAIFELAVFFYKRRPKLSFAATAACFGAFIWLTPIDLSVGYEAAKSFWTVSDGNGLLGRYAYGQAQDTVMRFIAENPFPIGLVNSGRISPLAVDSGPLYYMLCGSLPLVILMYGGLWFFLKRNLSSRSDRYHLFFAIVAAEFGIQVLLYPRTLCLLPAFVVLLNGLRDHILASRNKSTLPLSE